ncbi:hypothetical protein HDR58_07490 [bacterium]|nr:hypothetical protein [bacterium]
MATNKINDGVGKKIVEALKMQAPESLADDNLASNDILENSSQDLYESQILANESASAFPHVDDSSFDNIPVVNTVPEVPSELQLKIKSQLQEQQFHASYVDNAFQQSLNRNLGSAAYAAVQDDFEYPANVAVLRQLINKLPAGVSKQTGAVIIRQTMEALGISMPNVIQEAKQVQEALTVNSKECQANIIEYRRQISILEAKSQQYQRQAAVMNDIINLFIQS